MKITILTHLESDMVKEYDVVADQVCAALEENDHKASVLAVHGDIDKLVKGLKRQQPDLVFNLMETFGKDELGAAGVAGLLQLLGYPFTGGGPGETYLGEDKVLGKKLLAYEKLKYPDFAVFPRDADFETGGNLRPPFFVKPLRMDGSYGIDAQKALVNNVEEMIERVTAIHKKIGDDALAEEYIEGRELYVGVLGNRRPEALPPVEMDFSGLPSGALPVLDRKAKWDEKSDQFKGTKAMLADLPDETRARVQHVAEEAYRALRVRDYGRVDLRLTATGDIYVIEVNASCYLEKSSEFALAAQAAGIDYPTLIDKIVQFARERWPDKPASSERTNGKSPTKKKSKVASKRKV